MCIIIFESCSLRDILDSYWKKKSGYPHDPRTITVPIAFTSRRSLVSFERDIIAHRELNVPAVWLAAVQIIGLMGHRPCTIAVRRSFINVVLTKKLITIVADNHRYWPSRSVTTVFSERSRNTGVTEGEREATVYFFRFFLPRFSCEFKKPLPF